MKESRKKLIKIVTIVVCLALAGIALLKHFKGGPRGLASIPRGDVVWVKCGDSQCGAEYQMNRREFLEKVEERSAGGSPGSAPPVACKECQKLSARRAVKCEKCGHMFFYGANRNDFPDRCPECGHSERESRRKGQTTG
ncbi:MAG: hypothetical protein ACYSWQ_00765 [Planctomycetota bacterium]|jgi:hypothetical protein